MKIAIIGASGFLGKNLVEYFSKENEVISASLHPSPGIIGLDAANNKEVDSFMSHHMPDVVIDTVALTSSVACEKNPRLCRRLNFLTAKNLSKACRKFVAKMVFISSSYIFDVKKGNYNEEDTPFPTNEYAKTKIMAEQEVSKLPSHIILRIDLLYGLDNEKIKFGTRAFDNDIIEVGYPLQIRSPLLVGDLPKVISEILRKKQTGIFNVAGPDEISFIEFLRKLSSLKNPSEEIKTVDPSNWIIKSPKNSSLDISKINSLNIKTTSLEKALTFLKSKMNPYSQS